MWKEPRASELDAPPHMTEKIRTATFYNSSGKLSGADGSEISQYVVALLVTCWMLASLLLFLPLGNIGLVLITGFVLSSSSLVLLYFWGWVNYVEAWYHVDNEDKLFTVIRKQHDEWEEIEIPFETVNKVEYVGGSNGYAVIHAAGMTFETCRANSNRFASVTEMWSVLASFDTYMSDWPLTLKCTECNREFGHHIGTAQCPFDEMLLVDRSAKGRIDPEDIHPEDIDRV